MPGPRSALSHAGRQIAGLLLAAQLLGACAAPAAVPSATPLPQPPETPAAAATPATGAVDLPVDDFESATTNWRAGQPPDYADSGAEAAALSTQHATQGKQSVELSFAAGPQPRAIFVLEQPFDFSQASLLVFKLYNPGTVSGVAIALSTGSGRQWHESAVAPLQPGPRTVAFDLAGHEYKTDATGLEYRAAIADLATTQRLALIFYPTASGSVFVDDLHAAAGGMAPSPLETPRPPPEPTVAPVAPTRLTLEPPAAGVSVYGRVELKLETDGVFSNPFDPAQVDLEVRFTSPQGQAVRAPAFWYQDFDPATLTPVGEPGWRVRFTPAVAGAWTAQAELAPFGLESAPIEITVQPDPAARGFVRVNPANPRYFAFDDGSLFFPIGLNIGWARSLAQTVPDYERWFGSLSQNGGNVTRVWMADWSLGLEWNDTGLGDYTRRQVQAWLLDRVFDIAAQDGIYLALSLLNHGAFNERVDPEWDGNPYNAANGGMLAEPVDFATDPAARDYFKRRVRYIVARWGYSPNLMAWEWWNEVNWTPMYDDLLKPWIIDLTATLSGLDPYQHLVTLSYSDGRSHKLWTLPEISFVQQHDYSGTDPALLLGPTYATLTAIAPGKPVLLSEQGYSSAGPSDLTLSEAIHLHNGLWNAPFAGFAGTSMWWWWDRLVDPNGLWIEYRPIADFMRGEDLPALEPGLADAGPDAHAFTLQNARRALAWIRNKPYDASEAARAYTQALGDGSAGPNWQYQIATRSGLTLSVTGLGDGNYTAYWFDPQTGAWLAEAAVQAAGGAVALPIPDFSRDLALKLVPAGEPRTPAHP